jgi:recombination associated protein RdgC
MWFKNLQLYRLPQELGRRQRSRLEEQLARLTLQGCSATDPRSIGWVAPRDGGSLVHSVNQQWLLALGVEEKLLPASIVKRFASDKAKEIEEAEGRRIGRREMRELVEAMTLELLPRAFIRRRSTYGWIDRSNGWLVVDAASPAKAEEFLEHLRKSLDTLPAKVLKVAVALGGDDRLGRRRRSTSRLHPRPGPRTALD